MNRYYKILLGLLLVFTNSLLNAQLSSECPSGKEKSDYGFVNPCKSFIKWEMKPIGLGAIFGFDIKTLQKQTFCIYSMHPDGTSFYGKVETVAAIKFPIINRENMVVNLTPCKVHRFYVKDNFRYIFRDIEVGSYLHTKWIIESQNKIPTSADSILVSKEEDYELVQFSFDNEFIALEISNPNIKDVSKQLKVLSPMIRADFEYENLPYEHITFENEREIKLDSFYLGKNNFLKIKPLEYSLDLDLFENDYYIDNVLSSNEQYDEDLTSVANKYIQSFMGLYIENATVTIKIKSQSYEFENAQLLLDGVEINGVVNIDFSKLEKVISKEKLIKQFESKGFELNIPNQDSQVATLHFKIL